MHSLLQSIWVDWQETNDIPGAFTRIGSGLGSPVDHGSELVRSRAGNRCEYCLFPQESCSTTHHIEHIVARQHEASTGGKATSGKPSVTPAGHRDSKCQLERELNQARSVQLAAHNTEIAAA